MTYAELFEALKPFALDPQYKSDPVDIRVAGADGLWMFNAVVTEVDEDGQVCVTDVSCPHCVELIKSKRIKNPSESKSWR